MSSRKRTIRWAAAVCLILALVPPWDIYRVVNGDEWREGTTWGPLFLLSPPYDSGMQARLNVALLLAEWGAVVLLFMFLNPAFRRDDAQDGAGPAPVKNARNVVREVVRWAVPLGLAVVAAFVALVVGLVIFVYFFRQRF